MKEIVIFFVILQVFECLLCMILGVILYLRGIQKGIVICEMVNDDGSSAIDFFGQSREPAEHALIEDDSEKRKEKEDED